MSLSTFKPLDSGDPLCTLETTKKPTIPFEKSSSMSQKHFSTNVFNEKIEQDPEARQRCRVPNLTDWSKQPMKSTDQSIIAPRGYCSAPECNLAAFARGYCKTHYRKLYRSVDFEKLSPLDRFWSQVSRASKDECWPWIGSCTEGGYGRMMIGRKMFMAHRLSYEMHIGEIPAEHEIRHRCDTPGCVNPDHLLTGTHTQNMHDRAIRGRYKIPDETVLAIRQHGGLYKDIARIFGVSRSQVSYLKNYKHRQVLWTLVVL